ncbi:MAG: hypothetical protein LUH22_04055 [Bacteroides sp.]|nr:hypothetical protein [Bacteroides sp.]
MGEKYYSWSPYAYVMNNPMKYIPLENLSRRPIEIFVQFQELLNGILIK